MAEKNIVVTGMAEVSVKEIIALEKSVNEKDQLIGALREQINQLKDADAKKEKEFEAKQKEIKIITTTSTQRNINICDNCGYNSSYTRCPNCGYTKTMFSKPSSPSEVKYEYKNLDDVVEKIRKEETKKLGLDLSELQNQINTLTLEKQSLENDLTFKLKKAEEDLKIKRAETKEEISRAVESIKRDTDKKIDNFKIQLEQKEEELRKVKKDKTDDAVEAARKQEIIDLKERITELETVNANPLGFGWFRKAIYNWLKVDAKVKIAAEREDNAKKRRTKEISNNYPANKDFWAPKWMTGFYDYSNSPISFGW